MHLRDPGELAGSGLIEAGGITGGGPWAIASRPNIARANKQIASVSRCDIRIRIILDLLPNRAIHPHHIHTKVRIYWFYRSGNLATCNDYRGHAGFGECPDDRGCEGGAVTQPVT